MRMFICTVPRMQPVRILCVLIAAFLLSSPLAAQNAQTRNTGAQTDLHINVNVVRAAGVHRHDKDKDKDRDRHEDSVSYDLYPQHEEFSVTEEVRPMLVDSGNYAVRQEQVLAITVVPK
jgi:hypothetical protein